jgi:hypothetical protein
MIRVLKYFLIAFLLVLLAMGVSTIVRAQGSGSHFFPETGHYVKGAFLDYFQSAPDPLALFGYPITEQFQDEVTGVTVQYFQLARFEMDAQNKVWLSPLGRLLYEENKNPTVQIYSKDCRFFAQTSKSVCLGFLSYYDQMQGEVFFGAPISNAEVLDERQVQYFENARIEWRPDDEAGPIMGLSEVGSIYLKMRPAPLEAINYNGAHILESDPGKLVVRAFVERSLLPGHSTQQVYIIVQDENLHPVVDAAVDIIVMPPPGYTDPIPPMGAQLTNSDGLSRAAFSINKITPNQVFKIVVTATHGIYQATTTTWFRSWW